MPNVLQTARLLTIGAKNPVPRRKRKILKKAEKEIRSLEARKTARTRDVERQSGAPSDVTKKQREIAKSARRKLLTGN